MSDIWIPYGGGADLDPVTAGAADVRKGKVIVDKNGNPLTGTMAEIAAKSANAICAFPAMAGTVVFS